MRTGAWKPPRTRTPGERMFMEYSAGRNDVWIMCFITSSTDFYRLDTPTSLLHISIWFWITQKCIGNICSQRGCVCVRLSDMVCRGSKCRADRISVNLNRPTGSWWWAAKRHHCAMQRREEDGETGGTRSSWVTENCLRDVQRIWNKPCSCCSKENVTAGGPQLQIRAYSGKSSSHT